MNKSDEVGKVGKVGKVSSESDVLAGPKPEKKKKKKVGKGKVDLSKYVLKNQAELEMANMVDLAESTMQNVGNRLVTVTAELTELLRRRSLSGGSSEASGEKGSGEKAGACDQYADIGSMDDLLKEWDAQGMGR